MNKTGFLKRFLKKEFIWRKLWFNENYPTKFATTAWWHNQKPYLTYRVITAVYCVAILGWKMSSATHGTSNEVTTWFLSYPVWGYFLMTIYNILALICASFNFDYDCLCNDDMRWYHKVNWILHELAFNVVFISFGGSMIYFLSQATNNDSGMLVTEAFKSDDVIFYLINPVLMSADVFIVSISIRFLHFIFACGLFALYDLIHVYRWVSGNKPSHDIFYFGNLPAVTTAMFFVITCVLIIPFVQLIAYGIDYSRTALITRLRARNRHEILQTANSATHPKPESTKLQKNQSSLRYKTSAFQNKRPANQSSSGKFNRNLSIIDNKESSAKGKSRPTAENNNVPAPTNSNEQQP